LDHGASQLGTDLAAGPRLTVGAADEPRMPDLVDDDRALGALVCLLPVRKALEGRVVQIVDDHFQGDRAPCRDRCQDLR
jgi:hypothetical protein